MEITTLNNKTLTTEGKHTFTKEEGKLDNALNSKPEKKIHELKLDATFFGDVAAGVKNFELRKNDRGFKTRDGLRLNEIKDEAETGRYIDADIIYMLEDYTGLAEGYCMLGIKL